LVDAVTLETRATLKTGGRRNGAVIVARSGLGIAACIVWMEKSRQPDVPVVLDDFAAGRQPSSPSPEFPLPGKCSVPASKRKMTVIFRLHSIEYEITN
jgi:hypothetical protein